MQVFVLGLLSEERDVFLLLKHYLVFIQRKPARNFLLENSSSFSSATSSCSRHEQFPLCSTSHPTSARQAPPVSTYRLLFLKTVQSP